MLHQSYIAGGRTWASCCPKFSRSEDSTEASTDSQCSWQTSTFAKKVTVSMPKRSEVRCSAVLTTKRAELLFHWVTFLWWVLDVMPFNPHKALHCPIACLCHWRIILTIPEELHVRDFAQLSQLNFQPMLITIACDRWDTCQPNTTRAQA